MRKHRGLMSWTFQNTSAVYDTIKRYGNKFSHIGLFGFMVDDTGKITGSVRPGEEEVRLMHPGINWYLNIRNDGIERIFRALVERESAKQKFLDEINRLLDLYPWVTGIDLDLERGANDRRAESTALFAEISGLVRGRGYQLHADLPPKQGDNTPSWEAWCDYGALAELLDTALIMTYGFSWAGSAIGPITPRTWLEDTYDYAVTRFRPEQLFMGLPQYGYRWRIDLTPEEMGRGYRGSGGGYGPFLDWLQGNNTHTDGRDGQPATGTQPHIAWAGLWDEDNYAPHGYLHVYDLLDGRDVQPNNPTVRGTWGGRHFFASYQKAQDTELSGVQAQRRGSSYNERDDGIIVGAEGWVAVGGSGEASYRVRISEPGTYRLAVRVLFPWWDEKTLVLSLAGNEYTVGGDDVEQWYPMLRRIHWIDVAEVQLSAGFHTFKFLGTQAGSDENVRMYEFAIAEAVDHTVHAGGADAEVVAREMIDRDGNAAYPHENRFRIAVECLRREPDPAPVWEEQWREYPLGDFTTGRYVTEGSWQVVDYRPPQEGSGGGIGGGEHEDEGEIQEETTRALRGTGAVDLNYDDFADLVVIANVVPGPNTTGCGVQQAGYRAGFDIAGQKVVLYDGNTELASAPVSLAAGDSRTIRMRIRNGRADVWAGITKVLGPVEVTPRRGTVGLFSEGGDASFTVVRIGDAHWYVPMESFHVTRPDGIKESFGRVEREGVEWNRWGYFRLEDETREEGSTRTDDFSLDWVYLVTEPFALTPDRYPIKLELDDPGMWVGRIYLGDADGFSEAHWANRETIRRFADMAHYRWGLAGTGYWVLGFEDPFLLPSLLDQR